MASRFWLHSPMYVKGEIMLLPAANLPLSWSTQLDCMEMGVSVLWPGYTGVCGERARDFRR